MTSSACHSIIVPFRTRVDRFSHEVWVGVARKVLEASGLWPRLSSRSAGKERSITDTCKELARDVYTQEVIIASKGPDRQPTTHPPTHPPSAVPIQPHLV